MNTTIKKKKLKILESNQSKKNSTLKSCTEMNILQKEIKDINQIFKIKKKECDEELYSIISKYFDKDKNTIKDLCNALLEFYKHKKEKDVNYTLTFREFIMMFPRDSSVKDSNFRRQHVFEAICKIILFLNYDNNTFGDKKIFYESLEKYISGISGRKEVNKEHIINEKINSGSSAQSVDIFFKIPKNNLKKEKKYPCQLDYNKDYQDTNKKDLYILIQNKFYSNEYSSADKYDVNKIFQRARPLESELFENSKIKIVLMVNNSQLLDEKIKRNRNNDMGVVSNIYGLEELEDWFQNMIYDLYTKNDINNFFLIDPNKDKPILQLRFHQKLFVDTTLSYFTNEKIKKFIWGAVPRSGKSYIIAGMIDKINSDNDILIVLGATTETMEQFKKMFQELDNFNDYNIITTPGENKNSSKSKNIFIFSQEKIKINKKDDNNFDIKFQEDYSRLFNKRKLDIYFDEIHKGGSTKMSQEKIINTFINNNFTIDIFIMVTATYAKPTIAYSNIIDNKDPIIINWSYMDQQNMKEITNPRIREEIINSRKNSLEKNIIKDLFNNYNIRYGDEYLNILQEEYKKHPELVLIQPYLSLKKEPFNLSGNIFKLKCTAISNTLEKLKNPIEIFSNNDSVIDLINFIASNNNSYLNENTLYGFLHYKLKYDLNKRHTQLWFLPDNNLYDNPSECKNIINKLNIDEKAYDDDEDNDKKETSDGLPNIEPLSRGIALNLLKHNYFKDKYCFLIVHGQKINYYGKDETNEVFKNECVEITSSIKRTSINTIIEDYEEKTYKNGKSLIILTGSMLRLGVSLPCVDIAINFDDINSIDLNYQTMFRVLTERTGKTHGYYIDLNSSRAIKFLYQFNENYGKGFANADSIDNLTNNIQSLLYLFNYNGLNLTKLDSKKELELYDTLINGLDLSKQEYINYYKGNNKNIIEKLLISIGDIKKFDKLKTYLFTTGKKEKKNINLDIKSGEKRITALLDNNSENKDQKEIEEKQEEIEEKQEENQQELDVKEIADLLSTYTSMLSIFSDKNNMDCNSIDECIDKTIEDVSNNPDIFNCNYYNYNVFGSYINLIKNLNQSQFVKSLELYKELINSEENKSLKNALIIFFDNIKEVMKKDKLIYEMSPEEIQKKIEEYLPVRDAEKDKFGEVFTPIKLIEEMLDKLPKDVWKNKDYKWLDPANGIGNFPMIAYKKLMDGLKDVIKDEKTRSEHIIKNMLYMFEINPKNVGVSRKIFGKDANIFCGDFLSMDIGKATGIDKFDVIMGNPPFNKPQEGTRKGSYGGRTLWDKFVKKSLEILNKNGFLAFINPANWRGLGELHYLWDIISELQLLYLRIYGENDGKKYFNVGSRFDLYVLQNKSNTKPSEIIDEFGEKHLIKINEWPFLPNYNYKIFEKILISQDKGIDVIYSSSIYDTRKLKDKKTTEFKYPVVHSITKEGITYWYSNTDKKGHFGEPKVILNFNRHQYSHKEQNDYEGKLGMSQISFGIPIKSKKEGEEILKAVDTLEFKKIIASTKWGAFQTDYRMFKYFKPDFYKYLLSRKQNSTKKVRSLPSKLTNRKTISKRKAKSVGGKRTIKKYKKTNKNKN